MASRPNLLFLGLLAVGGYYFLKKSGNTRYTSGMTAFITGADIKQGNLRLTIEFHNANTMPLTIRSVIGNVLVNDKKIAYVNSFQTVEIAGNAKTNYVIDVRLTIATIVNSIAELTKGFAGSVLWFRGTVNANGVPTPVNLKFDLK